MEIHQLKYFVAVAEEMHFGRAAERLLVTPSPLSKQIGRLERELGGDLFVRDHHALRLTPLGIRILPMVREILERVDALRGVRDDRRKQLRLGVTPSAPASFVETVESALREVAPEMPAEITLAPTSELLPLLEQRKLDLAVVFRPVVGDRFAVCDVGEHGFLVGMTAQDPLAHRSSIRLTELATGTLVTGVSKFHPDKTRLFREQLRGAGVTNIVEVPNGNISVITANLRLLGARTLVPDVAHYPSTEALGNSSEFVLLPVEDEHLINTVALAATHESLREASYLHDVFSEVSEVIARRREVTAAAAARRPADPAPAAGA